MNITPELIERQSLPQIREGGTELYTKGAVIELIQYPRHLAGAVQSRKRYVQSFFPMENGTLLAQCTCAYSGARWCKHLVAAASAYLAGKPPVKTMPYPADQDLSGAWESIGRVKRLLKKNSAGWLETMQSYLDAGGPAAAFKVLMAAYELRNIVSLEPTFEAGRSIWLERVDMKAIAPQAGRTLLEILFQRLDLHEAKGESPIRLEDFTPILSLLAERPGLAQYLRIRMDGYGLVSSHTAGLYLQLLMLLKDERYAETIRGRYRL
ncbi:MAG: hypothetical protein AAFV07_17645 [Bacteroidota bacterium]